METGNISKTEPNEIEAWFRLPFTQPSQEMDRTYSAAAGACMGLKQGMWADSEGYTQHPTLLDPHIFGTRLHLSRCFCPGLVTPPSL